MDLSFCLKSSRGFAGCWETGSWGSTGTQQQASKGQECTGPPSSWLLWGRQTSSRNGLGSTLGASSLLSPFLGHLTHPRVPGSSLPQLAVQLHSNTALRPARGSLHTRIPHRASDRPPPMRDCVPQ